MHQVARYIGGDGMRSQRELTVDGTLAIGQSRVKPSRSATVARIVPQWDAMRRELIVGGQVVKRFRVPARNQEAVLVAFEEEGWPHRVYDPLSPDGDTDTKQRLRETIKALNGHRLARIIRFRGDGTGEGVCWELADGWC
jgi:hypothetical protein